MKTTINCTKLVLEEPADDLKVDAICDDADNEGVDDPNEVEISVKVAPGGPILILCTKRWILETAKDIDNFARLLKAELKRVENAQQK